MVVGTYHFVSKSNMVNLAVDDPLSAIRQKQIADVVARLVQFHPTKVVLEQTVGTSDLEAHYQQYIRGKFDLPASENYQIGFRVAKELNLPCIYTINVFIKLDTGSIFDFAKSHGQTGLIDKATRAAQATTTNLAGIQEHGTVLDLYRYLNSPAAIDLNESAYMYLARVGSDRDFVGADVVSQWQLRNLEMFAKLTRLFTSPNDRVLVLYGQGHEFLLKEYLAQSPDITLVDAQSYLG